MWIDAEAAVKWLQSYEAVTVFYTSNIGKYSACSAFGA